MLSSDKGAPSAAGSERLRRFGPYVGVGTAAAACPAGSRLVPGCLAAAVSRRRAGLERQSWSTAEPLVALMRCHPRLCSVPGRLPVHLRSGGSLASEPCFQLLAEL